MVHFYVHSDSDKLSDSNPIYTRHLSSVLYVD